MRSITSADVPVALKDDNVEVRITEVGEMTIGYFRFAKGTDLRPLLPVSLMICASARIGVTCWKANS